ncbi:hypothetical protein P7K49_007439 [Saguinus oedipus]|uniref:Uncharacterized protein n=1 Tax=Saguinus oedipus TaxID=9490 RepID=A0ABQ9VUW2_SAGOE|nr:hypothetical protein P7K49_007439 [Saguinus oedipus]
MEREQSPSSCLGCGKPLPPAGDSSVNGSSIPSSPSNGTRRLFLALGGQDRVPRQPLPSLAPLLGSRVGGVGWGLRRELTQSQGAAGARRSGRRLRLGLRPGHHTGRQTARPGAHSGPSGRRKRSSAPASRTAPWLPLAVPQSQPRH